MATQGKGLTIIDLDIVNPYFRTSDYVKELEKHNIKLIAPVFAGTTLDVPALPPQIGWAISSGKDYVVIDAGGDEVGAIALSRFSALISETDDFEMLYVVNKYRPLTNTPEKALSILEVIEQTSRLKANAIVNNSHLGEFTTAEDILNSMEYANSCAVLSDLPIKCTTAPKEMEHLLVGKIDNLFPVDIITGPLWK